MHLPRKIRDMLDDFNRRADLRDCDEWVVVKVIVFHEKTPIPI
jgi:hypothetical protein